MLLRKSNTIKQAHVFVHTCTFARVTDFKRSLVFFTCLRFLVEIYHTVIYLCALLSLSSIRLSNSFLVSPLS